MDKETHLPYAKVVIYVPVETIQDAEAYDEINLNLGKIVRNEMKQAIFKVLKIEPACEDIK